MAEWFEGEAQWSETYDVVFNPEKLAAGQEEIEKILRLVGVEEGAVLDLCCGPARHAIPLATMGYEVTGVDRTEYLLDKARTRAEQAGVSVTLIREDMRRYRSTSTFGLALCLFGSFGYFENRADDQVVLDNVHSSLQPGGVFVFDCAGKESLALQFAVFCGYEASNGTTVVIRRRICDDWERTRNEITLVNGDRACTFSYLFNLYSGQEIKALTQAAGFAEVTIYGNLDGDPYDGEAKTLLVVARKAS